MIRTIAGLAAGLALLASPVAGAAVVTEESPFATSLMFAGAQTRVVEFDIGGPGTVEITLTDLEWPAALADLSFIVTSATRRELDPSGAGSFSFETTGAGRFFAHVYAVPTGALNVGSAYLSVGFVPVPLPAAAWLFLAGAVGLGAFARRPNRAATTV